VWHNCVRESCFCHAEFISASRFVDSETSSERQLNGSYNKGACSLVQDSKVNKVDGTWELASILLRLFWKIRF